MQAGLLIEQALHLRLARRAGAACGRVSRAGVRIRFGTWQDSLKKQTRLTGNLLESLMMQGHMQSQWSAHYPS